ATYQIAKKYFKEIEPLLSRYKSPKLHIFSRSLELLMYSLDRDFDGIINTCHKAINHFTNEDYSNPSHIAVFYNNKAIACLQLSRYQEGIDSIEQAIKLRPEKDNNWANNLYILFLIRLHSENFEAAYEIIKKVKPDRIFSRMLPALQEFWRIGDAYIHFLIEAKVLDVPKKRNLKVARFLNQVPKFSKDYRVTNVPILIIQILFSILRKEYDQSIDRMKSVERYVSRYLRKDNTFRSNCFIKMLLCIPAANFNRIATERRAAKYLERLKESTVVQVEQTHEVEYIPYEKLWEITLGLLDTSTSRYRRT
ncbi:MAG: tetratricopeptide repeat protein, partial [Bacteroidota bacterium]